MSSFGSPSCVMNSQGQKPPPLWEIEFRVAEITSEQTSIPRERIRPDSRFMEDLHIDSLTMIEVILSLEEKFKVSIPDDIGKQMFVRSPLTISGLAEIVRHQWGTGVMERKTWFKQRPKRIAPLTIPFTQLGGALAEREWRDGPLYEPMASTAEGFSQFRRRTDGMRCVLIPAAEVELGSRASDGSGDEYPKHRVSIDIAGGGSSDPTWHLAVRPASYGGKRLAVVRGLVCCRLLFARCSQPTESLEFVGDRHSLRTRRQLDRSRGFGPFVLPSRPTAICARALPRFPLCWVD